MKNIYIEKWECVRSSYGKLYKLDLEKIAEEEMYPELLEMNQEELEEWLEDNDDILYGMPDPMIVSVCCESDPDHYERTVHTTPKDALDNIEWRGFSRGYADYNMSPEDAANKDTIVTKLKKELES